MMSDYETVLAAVAAVAAAPRAHDRASALAEGFRALGWDDVAVVLAVAPRRTVTAKSGAGRVGALNAPSPDALREVVSRGVPGASAMLPLGDGETLVAVAALAGNADPAGPLTSAYVRTVAAVLVRELEIERSASTYRHDLRAPLTVILGWCELLLETAEGGDREALQTILRQTERINSLLDEQAASGGTGPRAERL